MENSRSLTNDLFDPETGQELFKPRINRGPRGRPRQSSLRNVTENLYKDGLMRLQRRHAMMNSQENKVRKASATSFSKERTNKLMVKKKIQNFGEIFDKLDSDGDGRISAFKIDISSLDAK